MKTGGRDLAVQSPSSPRTKRVTMTGLAGAMYTLEIINVDIIGRSH